MPEQILSIGLDIGTTNTKALALDIVTGEVLSVASIPTPVTNEPDGDLREAQAVCDAAVLVLTDCIRTLNASERGAVSFIGVASVGEELFVVDADGRALAPSPTWYNSSVAEPGDSAPDATFGWHKLRWTLSRLDVEVSLARAVGFTSLGGVVTHALSEPDPQRAVMIDHTHASRTGFFDVFSGQWDTTMFAAAGGRDELLPQVVVPTGHALPIASGLATALGLSHAVTVTSAGHDHLCAGYASGARSRGDLFVSAGTAEAHVLLVDADAALAGNLPDGVSIGRYITADALYLHMQIAAGRIHQGWQKLLGAPEPDSGGPVRKPLAVVRHGTDTRVDLLDVDARTTAQDVAGAIIEGIAYAATAMDLKLAELGGQEIDRVLVAGPATANSAWRQARAQRSPSPIAVSSMGEPTAIGAARIAAAARGIPATPPRLTVLPADARLQTTYREIDEQLAEMHRRLNAL